MLMRNKTMMFGGMIVICSLFFCGCAGLKQTSKPSDQIKMVTVVISVKDAPNPVKAFGMDVVFPENRLSFLSLGRGRLLEKGFPMFGSNVIAPGKLRMGGVEPGEAFIPQAASGELVRITFEALPVNASDFQMTGLNSGFRGWLDGSQEHLIISLESD